MKVSVLFGIWTKHRENKPVKPGRYWSKADIDYQHCNAGYGKRDYQVHHRGQSPFYENIPPRFDIRYALHAFDDSEPAVPYPQPVDNKRIEPVHDYEKESGLHVCRFEIRSAIPESDDQYRHGEYDRAELKHKALALFYFGVLICDTAPVRLFQILFRIRNTGN